MAYTRRSSLPVDEVAVGFVVNGTAMRLDSIDDEVEAVRRMAARGVTLAEAARRLRMSTDTARKRAREARVQLGTDVPEAHWTYAYSGYGAARRRRSETRAARLRGDVGRDRDA